MNYFQYSCGLGCRKVKIFSLEVKPLAKEHGCLLGTYNYFQDTSLTMEEIITSRYVHIYYVAVILSNNIGLFDFSNFCFLHTDTALGGINLSSLLHTFYGLAESNIE